MKKIFSLPIFIMITGSLTAGFAAPPQGCGMELVSSSRLALPVPGSAGVKDGALAVDERGTLYVGFASWPVASAERRRTSLPQLASYDPSGKLLRVFERPATIPEAAEWARFTSLAYASGRIYAAAQWYEKGKWRSALFVFEPSGTLRRTVMLEGFGEPRIVLLGSNVGVVGTVGTERDKEIHVLRTFSADGEQLPERLPSEPLEPGTHWLSDATGRVLLVAPSGGIEVLRPRTVWAKAPSRFERIHAAFAGEGSVFVNRVDPKTRRMSLIFLNERGEQCELDTTGRLAPMVRGADGFFYGFGQLGIRPDAPPEQREIFVGKFRLLWRDQR